MSLTVFAIVIFSAALHAGWNAIVKGAGDTLLTTVLVAVSSAAIAVVCLPFLPAPATESWRFIAASTVCQVVYYVLVARAYRVADMSLAYPLMRGTAPLLVALFSVPLIGEMLAPQGWLGVGIISAGILAMATSVRPGATRSGVGIALANAVVIAGYTLIDGVGVRLSGSPAAYSLWIFLLTGTVFAVWVLATRRKAFVLYARRNWQLGLAGGACTSLAYGLALWAMTAAPIAMVAALRETSILFGTAISLLILHERVGRGRIIGACAIAAGAILLRLS